MKKAALHNLGCKVNAYETESMRQMLEKAGYEIVPFEPGADVYVINTCTVTNIADRKSRQMLHKARKMNPDAVVAAVGCYAEIRSGELQKDPDIDIVIGNNRKTELIRVLDAALSTGGKQTELEEKSGPAGYEEMVIERVETHTRAFVKVQDGCNQFCSYCIIPYARGRIRSRKIGSVLEEIGRLAKSGCREIVLTGIHLCSFGKGPGESETLMELIRAAAEAEGIARIRLGSLEPASVTEEMIRELASIPKVCPHFHLSLQSGCDRTLRRMNRNYTAAQFAETAELLRKYYTDPALTTDVIAGFPGETEEDFAESLAFAEKIRFSGMHIFPYSVRKGTRAAAFPEQLTEAEKKERCRVLQKTDEKCRREYLERFAGKKREVLFEEEICLGGRMYWSGYTPEYIRVLAESSQSLENRFETAELSDIMEDRYIKLALSGKLV